MKVRCIALLDSQGKPVEFSPWLSLGHVYNVLSVLTNIAGEKRLQIIEDTQLASTDTLGFHLSQCFEVISDYRPSCWTERSIPGGIELAPESWQSEGFWEAFYDGDPQAQQTFEEQKTMMINEEISAARGATTRA